VTQRAEGSTTIRPAPKLEAVAVQSVSGCKLVLLCRILLSTLPPDDGFLELFLRAWQRATPKRWMRHVDGILATSTVSRKFAAAGPPGVGVPFSG
jgi:hypothetical protein